MVTQMQKYKGNNKKRKVALPEEKRPIICPPDKAGMSLRTRVLGYICRALVTFTSVFGLVFFVTDALKLGEQEISVTAGYIALVTFISVALFSLMRLSKYCLAGGSVFLAGLLGVLLLRIGNIADFALKVILTAKNVALARLYNLGYYAMSKYMTEMTYSARYSREYYFKYAVAVFAVLLSLIFVLSVVKRVRVIPPAIISTALLGVVFTYNISRSNWGIVLIIASFVGLLVMAAYDRIFTAKTDEAKFDTKTILFEGDERPKLPEGMMTKKAERYLRREKRRELRKQKKKRKKEGAKISVDEELSDYFAGAKKSKRGGADVHKKTKLTPAEQKAEREKKRELRRQVRRVVEYERTISDARTAQGGFAAFGAFLIAMLMLLGPGLTVSGSFSTIEVIDRRMEYYREYVTALLMGDDPILDDLGYQNNKDNFKPRSTMAEAQNFTGAKIFTVETQYATNVYLRGWIGTDYEEGAWLPATEEQFERYRELYGAHTDPTETMFNYFYTVMNPASVADNDFATRYTSSLKYGFIAMQVNISRVETGDSLVYMPAFYRVDDRIKTERADGHGLNKYGEYGIGAEHDVTFVNYFDGIFTGRRFMSELAYASVSYVTVMKNINWYENVAAYIAEYNEGYAQAYEQIKKYAERREKGRAANLDTIVEAMFTEEPEGFLGSEVDQVARTKTIRVQYKRGVGEYVYDTETLILKNKRATDLVVETYIDPITGETVTTTVAFVPPDLPLAIRYRELMTSAERLALAYAYYYQYVYTDFVYDTYLDTAGSEIISDMLDLIAVSAVEGRADRDEMSKLWNGFVIPAAFSKAADKNSTDVLTYEQRHELVMAIVDYFKENYTYTLEPSVEPNAALDGVENFLAVTKEGYCIQFASALALLLREAGIPARYVEGYVACDFKRNYSTDAVARYVTSVRDYNAHAWVEVWYDGVGWVQYEATPVYYDDMYLKDSGEGAASVRPWYDPEEEIPEEELLLESILSTLDVSNLMIESMRDDIKYLIGRKEILKSLGEIEKTIASLRSNWEKQRAFYDQNKDSDEYDADDFIRSLNSFSDSIYQKVSLSLLYQSTRIESTKAMNRLIALMVFAAIVAATLVVIGIVIGKRAKKAERERAGTVERIIAQDFTEKEQEALSRRLIDWLTALLAAYGSAPQKGEFRDEYADRLTAEYLDIFGRAKDSDISSIDSPSALTSDTDFHKIFDSIAAEEFGYGMSADEMSELAKFYRRMRSGEKKRIKPLKRVFYHYFKKII